MSLTISASANPELKVPGSTKSGHLLLVDPLCPLELLKTSIITCGSSPKRWPAAITSAVDSRWVADSRLFSA